MCEACDLAEQNPYQPRMHMNDPHEALTFAPLARPTGIDATLAERGSRYGDFTDHARVCQSLKHVMAQQPGWQRLSDVQKQALEVIADKQARILTGDPDYADNWHDIQGYAKLVEDRLPRG